MNSNKTVPQKTRIIGRLFRFLLGIFFVTEVWPVYQMVTTEGILLRLSWAVGLAISYILIHFLAMRFASRINGFIGGLLAFGPIVAVYTIGYGGPAATGALTFLAVSLMLAAIRADPGCEVMSIPSIIFGKHTHLGCLLFSPIDYIESKFA